VEQINAETPQILEGRAAYAAKVLELVRSARHELLLHSDALDSAFYGGAEFTEAVKQFLLGSQRAQLRVLVNQAPQAHHNVPQLLELWLHLSSRMEFREPHEQQRENFRGERLIVDQRAIVERASPEVLEGRFWAQAPQQGKIKSDDFEKVWNEGQPSAEFRSLGI
jgi:hypothetical protein